MNSLRQHLFAATTLFTAFTSSLVAQESAQPKPIPASRPAMKQALDDLKHREPRLPLPAPSEEDKASGDQRRLVNNGRMRQHYLGNLYPRSSGTREKDPNMSLDNAFTVEFFWIASRVNNCHYCLGHQENKLLAAGRSEDRIAALDCDWSQFNDAERAAFAFARKLTYEPHLVTVADLKKLEGHYKPLQVLEICFLVAGYNSTNRWTDGMGIPQEDHRTFVTETSEKYLKLPSVVAPSGPLDRGPLESRSEVEAKLAACKTRKPTLPLVSEAEARKLLDISSNAPVPAWIRLLANFPISGKSRIEGLLAARSQGNLTPLLKAQMDWVAARQDRAWYALSDAQNRLRKLGQSDDQIFSLDGDRKQFDASTQAALHIAQKLTASPQVITDSDIAPLRKHFSDPQVAEVVYYTTQAAFFNRVAEAAQLPSE